MKGHIRERSPGHWAIVIDIRDPPRAEAEEMAQLCRTKRQAQIECARLISAVKGNDYLETKKITIAAHMERWLDHVDHKSRQNFRTLLRRGSREHCAKFWGSPSHKSAAGASSEMHAKALVSGRRDGKGGLSPASVCTCTGF